jgi:hypothetical protein
MIIARTRKQSWALLALTAATILFSLAPQMTAAQTAKVQLTTRQAKALAATAKTPEDHMKLAAYFNREADRLEADAKDHEGLGQTYRLYPSTLGGGRRLVGTRKREQSNTARPLQNRSAKRQSP